MRLAENGGDPSQDGCGLLLHRSFAFGLEMLLFANGVSLAHPAYEDFVDIRRRLQPERVQMIPGRERLDLPESRMLEPPGEDDMPINPAPPRGELGEGHANLESDSCLLWQHFDLAQRSNDPGRAIVQGSDLRRLSGEMMIEIVRLARVGLIAVGERSPAFGTAPKRRLSHTLSFEMIRDLCACSVFVYRIFHGHYARRHPQAVRDA